MAETRKWHALLEADRSYFHAVNCCINQPIYCELWQCTTNSWCQHSAFKSFETVPRRGVQTTLMRKWQALLEVDRSHFHTVNCFINQPSYSKLWQCTTNCWCQHSTFKSAETVPRWGVKTTLRWRKVVLTTHKNWWISKIAFIYAYEFEIRLLFGVKFRLV